MRWNTLRVTAAGFFGVIFLGALLLYLPISNREPIAFADAMFTSVTSVCVTGLVTITPATQFTLFGKVVLLILIQIGGLGVIACAALFFLLLRRRLRSFQTIFPPASGKPLQPEHPADASSPKNGRSIKYGAWNFFVFFPSVG